jgi:hypothetical protein
MLSAVGFMLIKALAAHHFFAFSFFAIELEEEA